jgi:hypothetical protein
MFTVAYQELGRCIKLFCRDLMVLFYNNITIELRVESLEFRIGVYRGEFSV